MQGTSWLYKLPIPLVVKICSYTVVKNTIYYEYDISRTSNIIALRTTCKLLCHFTKEKNWWEQIYKYLDSNTCTFYCYKILDFCMTNHNNLCQSIFKNISTFRIISKNLKPSVKVAMLRFIAIHNYKFDRSTGTYFFKTLLGNNLNIQETTTEQLVKTLCILEDKQFYTYYIKSIDKTNGDY